MSVSSYPDPVKLGLISSVQAVVNVEIKAHNDWFVTSVISWP